MFCEDRKQSSEKKEAKRENTDTENRSRKRSKLLKFSDQGEAGEQNATRASRNLHQSENVAVESQCSVAATGAARVNTRNRWR